MARRYACKCQICGKSGYTDEFYRVKKKNKNLYYCNEEEYLEWKKEKDIKTELLIYISNEIWHYDNYKMLPAILKKQINQIAEIYNYEVILKTAKKHKDTLEYWMNLEGKFDNEYGKSSYMMAIIKNNINEVYKQWKHEKKTEQNKNKISVDLDIINNLQQTQLNNTDNNGILDFLEEEDI